MARLALALDCAALLFPPAAGLGALHVWQRGAGGVFAYLTVIALAAAAALLFVFIALVVPGLLAVGRIAFPLNLTLPLVYGLLLLTLHHLWLASWGGGVLALPEAARRADVWSRPSLIGLVMLVQFAALTGVGWWKRR